MTKELTSKDRQDLAELYDRIIDEKSVLIRKSTIMLASAFYEIKENNLYLEKNFETFEHYCIEKDFMPSTIKRYIKVYQDLCLQGKIKPKEIQDIALNKLSLIKNLEDKNKWIQDARVLKYKDLKRKINESQGLPVKEEIDEYLEKKERKEQEQISHIGCPHWQGRCKLEKY